MQGVNRIAKWLPMRSHTKGFEALRKRINDLGLRASVLADIIDIDEARISQFIAGQIPSSVTPLVEKLCRSIGIEVGPFLDRRIVVDPSFDPSSLQTPQAKLEAILSDKTQSKFIRQAIDLAFDQLNRSRDSG